VPAIPWKALLNRTVLVSQAMAISGALDDLGQMATIEGGDNPFAIEAPGARGASFQGKFIFRSSTENRSLSLRFPNLRCTLSQASPQNRSS